MNWWMIQNIHISIRKNQNSISLSKKVPIVAGVVSASIIVHDTSLQQDSFKKMLRLCYFFLPFLLFLSLSIRPVPVTTITFVCTLKTVAFHCTTTRRRRKNLLKMGEIIRNKGEEEEISSTSAPQLCHPIISYLLALCKKESTLNRYALQFWNHWTQKKRLSSPCFNFAYSLMLSWR